ncbi:MAG: 23S rRNA (pseudouridine(1915)-N(3))-methyltransferase RlmH [Candidatus Omnitrophica bacterium]|nr:23S rRNA (pseudouridine(1915)-N(3))-methyltransferase RlmH [Candidatus Omnitrophota bacterium]
MNIKIISLDRGRDRDIKKVEETFITRLSKYCKIEFVDIKRSAHYDTAKPQAILTAEASHVMKRIKESDHVILLDPRGRQMDSITLAQSLKALQQQGVNSLVFIIGGPLGVSDQLREKARSILSLSKLTFTHEMARMLLCEALYRSFDILHGGNYHK